MCLFLAANEKIFESHHFHSQSMCYGGAVGQTAACSVAASIHPCAAPCKAVCAQLESAWIAPAWLTPAALLQGVHPLALKNTEINTEWSRGVV